MPPNFSDDVLLSIPKKRRVTLKDKNLLNVYNAACNELFIRQAHRPFTYDIVEGQPILYLYDTIRFTKTPNNFKIVAEEWNSHTNEWLPLQRGLYQMDPSPIMWPINSSQSNSWLCRSTSYLSADAILEKHFNVLLKTHPEYKTDKSLHKSVVQLNYVFALKWRKILNKPENSFKGATKFWWDHFVDRSVFKSLIDIVGVKKTKQISWEKYCEFHNNPFLKTLQKNIQDLGPFAQLLSLSDLKTQKQINFNTVVPQMLHPHLDLIREEPVSIQQQFVLDIANGVPDKEIEDTWLQYKKVKQQSQRWLPRELNFVWIACKKTTQSSFFAHQSDRIMVTQSPKLIRSFIAVFKKVYPNSYRYFSFKVRSNFEQMVKDVLKESEGSDKIKIPDSSSYDLLRIEVQRKHLQESIDDNINCKETSSIRRRRM